MKTNDLIAMLSTQAGPAPKISVASRLLPAGIAGGLLAAAMVLGVLGLIPTAMFAEPGPWIKNCVRQHTGFCRSMAYCAPGQAWCIWQAGHHRHSRGGLDHGLGRCCVLFWHTRS